MANFAKLHISMAGTSPGQAFQKRLQSGSINRVDGAGLVVADRPRDAPVAVVSRLFQQPIQLTARVQHHQILVATDGYVIYQYLRYLLATTAPKHLPALQWQKINKIFGVVDLLRVQ